MILFPTKMNIKSSNKKIQSRLLDIGSHVATPRSSASEKRIGVFCFIITLLEVKSCLVSNQKLEITSFSEEHLKKLEQWIDQLDQKLPPLRNFILPVRNVFVR